MTQLFDTKAFAAPTDDATDDATDAAQKSTARHLRSLPTGADVGASFGANPADLAARTTQWQLDPDTIETGRRGIALARAALKEAAKRNKAA